MLLTDDLTEQQLVSESHSQQSDAAGLLAPMLGPGTQDREGLWGTEREAAWPQLHHPPSAPWHTLPPTSEEGQGPCTPPLACPCAGGGGQGPLPWRCQPGCWARKWARAESRGPGRGYEVVGLGEARGGHGPSPHSRSKLPFLTLRWFFERPVLPGFWLIWLLLGGFECRPLSCLHHLWKPCGPRPPLQSSWLLMPAPQQCPWLQCKEV